MTGTASDNVGVASVEVRVNSGAWQNATGTTSWSKSVTLASGGNTIEARSKDTAGNYSTTTSISATYNPPDTTAPTVPAGLTATAVSTSQINLSWSASTDSGGSGLAGYKVYRGGVQIATTTASSYSDSGRAAATQYCYAVAAYDNAGNASAQSSQACATTPESLPVAPSALTATAISSNQINLVWTDNSNDETSFKIERAFTASGPWSQAATVGAGATSYSNTSLACDTQYYYRVRATNGAGDSADSNVANARTASCSTPPGSSEWAMSLGGTGMDYAYAVANDTAGNIYVAGYFSASADFGGGALTQRRVE